MQENLERHNPYLLKEPNEEELKHAKQVVEREKAKGRSTAILVHDDGRVTGHDFGSRQELETWMDGQGASRNGTRWYFERPDVLRG